jgi:multimeric flavodoxin WrbA
MKMRVLMISGSRNRAGQTAQAAQSLLEGAASAGAEVESVFLPELDIQRCRQCNPDGWGTCRSAGSCCVTDDFAGVVAKIAAADAVIFATPVYWGDLSESIRAFLDRLRRITRHEAGRKQVEGRTAFGVCVAGGGGGGSYACAASLDKVLVTCGFNVVDITPVRRQNADLKRQVLRATGAWLAQAQRDGNR